MYRLMMTLGAAAAWLLLGHFGLLAVLAYVWVSAMSTTNTAKTRAVEQRVSNLVTTTGNSLAQLNEGIFTKVPGGTVTLTGGNVTLHCGALSQLDTETQTAFLAGLSKTQSPGGVAMDPNSGSSWASGERANYINDLRADYNALLGTFIAHGFMNSA